MSDPGGRWLAVRRPLLVAFVLGCAMSLMTSGRLTPRLVLPAALYWSFVPFLQVACLVVSHRRARPPVHLSRAIDRFFSSFTPWLIWLVAYASVWAFVPPERITAWQPFHAVWYTSAGVAMLWAAYLDFRFFRAVFARTRARAALAVVLHRAVAWTLTAAVFLFSAGWQVVASELGL